MRSDQQQKSVSMMADPLAQAQTLPIAGRIARSLLILLFLLLLLLVLTPWQQNVRGVGRVIAYSPAERQQIISAPIEGRVSRWLVKEGGQIKQGQILAELIDNDPLLLQRLQSEQEVLLARQTAVESRVETFRTQLKMAEQARPQALKAAESRINMAKQRRDAAVQGLDAARAAQTTAELNLHRQQQLRDKGLTSQRNLELSQLSNTQRAADRNRALAAVSASENEISALQADLQKLSADTAAAIEKTRAELNKAIEDQNYVKADILKLQTRLARQQTQTITAPQDGTVLRLLANPGAELLKAGQDMAILVPDAQTRAVELWVDGNDLPLIVTGSPVRLQFEGYPAIQFGGWPELSVGSFAGQVTLIDASDDGKGHFRVLVAADPEDLPWPDARFLRQGVRVNGWILLGQVTLGYELWRIFNGFPPLVLPEPQLNSKQSYDKVLPEDNSEKKQ